jgi:hypothetical protein
VSDINEDRPQRLLSRTAQATRYGVAVRTVERWGENKDGKMKPPMPPEVEINERFYRYEHELQAWERARIVRRNERTA